MKCFPYKVECPEFEAVRNMIQNGTDSNLDVFIYLHTKLDIDNAFETLTNYIVEARSIKFESMIIDDDLNLLIGLKNVRRRQFQRTRDPDMKIILQGLQEEINKHFAQLKNKNFENKISQLDLGSKFF